MKKILISIIVISLFGYLVISLFSYSVIPFATAKEKRPTTPAEKFCRPEEKCNPTEFCGEECGLLSMVSDCCYKCGDCTLCDALSVFISLGRLGLKILGSLTLLMLIYGGLSFIWAGGMEERVTKAKKILTGALTGFIIGITAFALVNFVISTLTDVEGKIYFTGGAQREWYKVCTER